MRLSWLPNSSQDSRDRATINCTHRFLHRLNSEAMRYLRLYSIYSCHWPANFRPTCRSAVYTLYMRSLCLCPPGAAPTGFTKQGWREDARRVALDLKSILDVTTTFPRAGEVNHRVLDFVDLCVAVWEKGGAREKDAAWVVDVRKRHDSRGTLD